MRTLPPSCAHQTNWRYLHARGRNSSSSPLHQCQTAMQPVREAVNDRGLFTAGWFGVREKHCSWLEIYDRLRASKQAVEVTPAKINSEQKKSRKSNIQGPISFCFTEAGGSTNMQSRMLPSSFAKGRSEFPSSPKSPVTGNVRLKTRHQARWLLISPALPRLLRLLLC